MKKFKDYLKLLLMILFVLGMIAIPVSCEYNVWQECLQKNSTFYCIRVLS